MRRAEAAVPTASGQEVPVVAAPGMAWALICSVRVPPLVGMAGMLLENSLDASCRLSGECLPVEAAGALAGLATTLANAVAREANHGATTAGAATAFTAGRDKNLRSA